jgi:hypothetical protein
MIDNRADFEAIIYVPSAGISNGWYYLADEPPTLSFSPVIDLTGYTATGAFYDKCGGTLLNSIGSATGELSFFTATETFYYEDDDTGVITSYEIVDAQGLKFSISPVTLAGYVWTTAYFEINIVSPGGVIIPFKRGTLSTGDCC